MSEERFDQWCMLEIMGHQTFYGHVTTEEIGGTSFIRIDVPEVSDPRDGETVPAYTKYFHPNSLYGMTPITEESARLLAARQCKQPISVYGVMPISTPRALPRPEPEEDENYESEDADEDDRPTCGCQYCPCTVETQAGEVCDDCRAGAHQG